MFSEKNILSKLQSGEIRAASPKNNNWNVNIDVKKAIIKIFKTGKSIEYKDIYAGFVDKNNLLTRKFKIHDKVRMVPGGSAVRVGSYIAPSVTIMPPSYINIGSYIDIGSMIDSHVLIGSCAQIGKYVHLSAGVKIGGVLEPIGMNPVIIEDHAFIGAGATIVEGIIVGKKAVIAPSVVLSKGVSVYDCVNEKILEKGSKIPEKAIVIPGSRPIKSTWGNNNKLQAMCPIIIKYRDDKSNEALSLEEALR